MASGLKFARGQLEKTGWKEGSGLGRHESGIKEAIKVKIKADNKGIGHDAAEEFTFHWWDHAFNKAANNIKVCDTEDGISVEMTEKSGPISSKKPATQKMLGKSLLYGRFVKSGTVITNGVEEKNQDSSESSDSSDDDDLSSKQTDEDLFKLCEGRTAHKGARHGLGANGKLERVEKQEQALLDKMRRRLLEEREKEAKKQSSGRVSSAVLRGKLKKWKSGSGSDSESASSDSDVQGGEVKGTLGSDEKQKKLTGVSNEKHMKLTSVSDSDSEMKTAEFEVGRDESGRRKKVKKSKRKRLEVGVEDLDEEGVTGSDEKLKKLTSVSDEKPIKLTSVSDSDSEVNNVEVEVGRDESKKRKKAKKSKRKSLEVLEVEDLEQNLDCGASEKKSSKKKKKIEKLDSVDNDGDGTNSCDMKKSGKKQTTEADVAESASPEGKKKAKKSKRNRTVGGEIDVGDGVEASRKRKKGVCDEGQGSGGQSDADVVRIKKKKSKRKKDKRDV